VPRGGERLDHRAHFRRITRALVDHIAFVASPAYEDAAVVSVA